MAPESAAALAARIAEHDRRLAQADEYRHEMRGETTKVALEVAVIHTELGGLREDLTEFMEETTTSLKEITATSAAGVAKKSNRRFQLFLAIVGPVVGSIIGGAIALLALGGSP